MNVAEDISPVDMIDVNAIAWVLFPLAEDRTNPPALREWVLSTLQALLVDGGKKKGRDWTSAMEKHILGLSKCNEQPSVSAAASSAEPGPATAALLHVQGGSDMFNQEINF